MFQPETWRRRCDRQQIPIHPTHTVHYWRGELVALPARYLIRRASTVAGLAYEFTYIRKDERYVVSNISAHATGPERSMHTAYPTLP